MTSITSLLLVVAIAGQGGCISGVSSFHFHSNHIFPPLLPSRKHHRPGHGLAGSLAEVRTPFAAITAGRSVPMTTAAFKTAARAATKTTTSLDMFTGIVEEIGTVVSFQEQKRMTLWNGSQSKGTELVIQGDKVLDGAYLGCSICVSGVCLTATALDHKKRQFKVGLAPETLRRTYFASLKPGDSVNLERASEIGGRNSGHFVQGHVDGTGEIIQRWPDGDSMFFQVRASPDLLTYIVPKGFVAVDGTSLTVVHVNLAEGWFSFMLVDYTQKHVIMPSKQVGDLVNIEVDMLGKYAGSTVTAIVERLQKYEAMVDSFLPRLENLEAEVELMRRRVEEVEEKLKKLERLHGLLDLSHDDWE